jgi:hypothetical protein
VLREYERERRRERRKRILGCRLYTLYDTLKYSGSYLVLKGVPNEGE